MDSNKNPTREPEFEEPVDVILWASRVYLLSLIREQPVPDILPETFDEAGLRYMYDALVRTLDRLYAGTTVTLTVHDPDCPCASFYEQAIVTGLRALQGQNVPAYVAALSAVLPPAAVRLVQMDMAIVASALADIERFWPMVATVDSERAGYRRSDLGLPSVH